MFFYSRKEAEKEAAKDALKNSKSFFFNFSINSLNFTVRTKGQRSVFCNDLLSFWGELVHVNLYLPR